MFKTTLIVTLFTSLLGACTYIDDYAFGKDNTPRPLPTPKIQVQKDIQIDWSARVGSFKKNTATIDLQPAIAGSVIYTALPNGKISAISKSTGEVLWQRDTHLSLIAGPVLSGSSMVVTGDDSAIYILNIANGQVLRRVSVANDVLAKPLIHAGKIYAKTITAELYCIDLQTGHKDWKYKHNTPEIILKASSSPIDYLHTILAGFSDGSIVSLDPLKGHPIFQQHVSFAKGVSEVERLNDVDTNPLIDENRLYIASYQGEVGAYSIPESDFIWKRNASTYHDLAFIGHTLVLVSSADVIWAYDKFNGQVLWTQKRLKARNLTAPVIWQKAIWVGDRLGTLHAIKPSSGQLIGQVQLPGSMVSSPVVEGDVCYVLTTNGQLHRLSLRN